MLLLFLLLFTGCAERSGGNFGPGAQGAHVRVYEMEDKWSPESNCKQIDYVKIYGKDLTKGEEGYHDALFRLRLKTSQMGGTAAKIRDVAPDFLFAYIYFCSPDYSK